MILKKRYVLLSSKSEWILIHEFLQGDYKVITFCDNILFLIRENMQKIDLSNDAFLRGKSRNFIGLSIVLIVLSYVTKRVFDYYDFFGYEFLVALSYLFYLGIIEIGLMKPYRILFEELKDREKTEFLSLAAHRLRTPLASISLSSELLLRGAAGNVEEKQIGYLKEIYHSAHQMSDLIYFFLNISRIELGTFIVDKRLIKIVQNVDESVNSFATQAKEKNIIIEKRYDDSLMINFDKNVLKIIVDNLLVNAIRYTRPGGKISVAVSENKDGAELKITDTGCGIPLYEQSKIFNKSFRAENVREMNHDGLGLGLYIVKSVAEKAGAKIRFESEINKGTTFYVNIPIR